LFRAETHEAGEKLLAGHLEIMLIFCRHRTANGTGNGLNRESQEHQANAVWTRLEGTFQDGGLFFSAEERQKRLFKLSLQKVVIPLKKGTHAFLTI
jgi:hypothetical protein